MVRIKKILLISLMCAGCFNLKAECTEIFKNDLENKIFGCIDFESTHEIDKKALDAFKEAFVLPSVEKWQEALRLITQAITFHKEHGEREKVSYYEVNKHICIVNLNLEKSKKVESHENFDNLENSLLEAAYALSSEGRIEEAGIYLVMSSRAKIKKTYLQVHQAPSVEGWRRIENMCAYAYNTYKHLGDNLSQYFYDYWIISKACADYLQAQSENSLKSWEEAKQSGSKALKKFLILGDYHNFNIMKSRIKICNCNILKLTK
ncbi:MAG: hypothetical protein ACI4PR_01460 [Acutalibacteraceae bacterium]